MATPGFCMLMHTHAYVANTRAQTHARTHKHRQTRMNTHMRAPINEGGLYKDKTKDMKEEKLNRICDRKIKGSMTKTLDTSSPVICVCWHTLCGLLSAMDSSLITHRQGTAWEPQTINLILCFCKLEKFPTVSWDQTHTLQLRLSAFQTQSRSLLPASNLTLIDYNIELRKRLNYTLMNSFIFSYSRACKQMPGLFFCFSDTTRLN